MRAEDALQIAVANHLRLALGPEWRFLHGPNGFHVAGGDRSRAAREANKLKRMGLAPGAYDLIVFGPREHASGGAVFIELKSATGSLEPEQRAWRDHAQACGRPWALCRSIEEVEAFLDACAVPLAARVRPVRASDSDRRRA